jgi:hypothetical protein
LTASSRSSGVLAQGHLHRECVEESRSPFRRSSFWLFLSRRRARRCHKASYSLADCLRRRHCSRRPIPRENSSLPRFYVGLSICLVSPAQVPKYPSPEVGAIGGALGQFRPPAVQDNQFLSCYPSRDEMAGKAREANQFSVKPLPCLCVSPGRVNNVVRLARLQQTCGCKQGRGLCLSLVSPCCHHSSLLPRQLFSDTAKWIV